MNKMELYNYYRLDECVDRKRIIKILKSYEKDGKIDYTIDGESLHIEDLDLDESDIDYLSEIFEENDVFVDNDREEDDDSDYYDDYGFDDDDY